MNTSRRPVWVATLWMLALTACGGAQKTAPKLYEVAPSSSAGNALDAWFKGDEAAAAALLDEPSTQAEHAFVAGEVAYGLGDAEQAFERFAWLVARHPDHPLTRYAAARLYTLRDTVLDFPERASAMVAATDLKKLDPLARVYVAMTEQTAEFRRWDRSNDPTPFDGGAIGFPHRWNITPTLSPFRLTDFDQSFAPEGQAQLAPTYLSPAFATDQPINHEKTRPYFPTGLNLAPGVQRDGLYYLETFATAAEARDVWVYGNFAGRAQVFVDGVEVIDREEDDYTSGKRLRKIRLSAGTHRVLVKLGVQRGYRDWFDLQFVPDGRPVGQGGLSFMSGCLPDREVTPCWDAASAAKPGKVELLTKAVAPSALESVFVPAEAAPKAGDLSLYLTMLGAFFSAEDEAFDAAWQVLSTRRPDFAAGHALRSQQVQTLWQWPSRLRDATALQELRLAQSLAPESALYTHELSQKITGASDREVRELMERAAELGRVDNRVRLMPALEAWARYLEAQGYDEASEKAWRAIREIAPNHCDAARAVQKYEQARNVFLAPEVLIEQPERCPAIVEAYQGARPEDAELSLAQYKKYASRFPYNAETQVRYANELVRMGRVDEAKAHVAESLRRVPDSATLMSWTIDRSFAEVGRKAALDGLAKAEEILGSQAWIVWKRALLDQKIPLMEAMPDGHKAAMAAVEASKTRALSTDDAYYVVDFAATHYTPDGAHITLTHTLVRVLTKNAIDRFAETQVPSDARLLLVRTIKQDGSVFVPEDTPGKQTLSMPALAEGDFVELAYIQYSDATYPKTERDGIKFFFRMGDISTLHSEYVILGDVADFILMNDPPNAEPVEVAGVRGVRFLAKSNPRPREERFSVSVDEYLPWVQMYRNGLTMDRVEAVRRTRREQIEDGSKPSSAFDEQVEKWLSLTQEMSDLDRAKTLFYQVAAWIPEPSLGDFSGDVSHAVMTREGNSLTLLNAVYKEAGFDSDIYLIRSPYAAPEKLPTREAGNFNTPILRLELEDQVFWLSPSGPDAMFGALETAYQGQEVMCISCDAAEEAVVAVPTEGFLPNDERIEIKGAVDARGDLAAEVRLVMEGASAEPLRAGLRARTDEANREKLMGAIAAQLLAGSSVEDFQILNETNPDVPLEIRMKVTRGGFARPNAAGLSIETRLFDEPLARVFASMPERTVPMMISYPRDGAQRLELSFPRTPQVVSLSGTRENVSKFGRFQRSVHVQGNTVVVENTGFMPVQRVAIDDYPAFQKWAIEVEQNSPFVVVY